MWPIVGWASPTKWQKFQTIVMGRCHPAARRFEAVVGSAHPTRLRLPCAYALSITKRPGSGGWLRDGPAHVAHCRVGIAHQMANPNHCNGAMSPCSPTVRGSGGQCPPYAWKPPAVVGSAHPTRRAASPAVRSVAPGVGFAARGPRYRSGYIEFRAASGGIAPVWEGRRREAE